MFFLEAIVLLALSWVSCVGWVGFISQQLRAVECQLEGFPTASDPHWSVLGVMLLGFVLMRGFILLVERSRKRGIGQLEHLCSLGALVMGLNLALMLRMVLVVRPLVHDSMTIGGQERPSLRFEALELASWAAGGIASGLLLAATALFIFSLLRKSP